MGWAGDRCWFCRADLAGLMALDGLPEEWQQMREVEFDRHMSAECIADPRTDLERAAADREAEEQSYGRAFDDMF